MQCLLQLALLEIGPENIWKMEFRIGALPQEEVAESLLPGGADKQIRRWDPGCEKMTFHTGFVDLLHFQRTRCNLPGNRPDSLEYFLTTSIINRDDDCLLYTSDAAD